MDISEIYKKNKTKYKRISLKTFSELEVRKFARLQNSLSDKQLLGLLICRLQSRHLLNRSGNEERLFLNDPDGPRRLLFKLMSVNCTISQLVDCMYGSEFIELRLNFGLNFGRLKVIEQPGDPNNPVNIELERDLILQFIVDGIPVPSFQWFYNDNPLEDGVECTLKIKNFQECDEGFYHCIATQVRDDFKIYKVKSAKIQCLLIIHKPILRKDLPSNVIVKKGSPILLSVKADDDFFGSYEWRKNKNSILPNEINSELKIDAAEETDEGLYQCVLSCRGLCTFSNICYVNVSKEDVDSFMNPCHSQPGFVPTAKVALLIGNNEYTSFSKLCSSMNDVTVMADCLTELGFNVTKFINLSKTDMHNAILWFARFIIPSSFVFFYFSGHGFSLSSNKFMMPTDCPDVGKYNCSDCISNQFIKKYFVEAKPSLLIEVLDMCLISPDRDENPQLFHGQAVNVPHYEYTNSSCTVIEACSTSEFQKSYENYKDKSYSMCISEHLREDGSVNDVLHNAHKRFAEYANSVQNPWFSTQDNKYAFKLTTPSIGGESSPNFLFFKIFPNMTYYGVEEYTLHFQRDMISPKIIVCPCCDGNTLNSLAIQFPPELCEWALAISISEVNINFLKKADNPCLHFIIPNIHMIKGDFFTLTVDTERRREEAISLVKATLIIKKPEFFF